MKHFLNTRSNKYLCEVKYPKRTDNTTIVGTQLAAPESWCPVCHGFVKGDDING